MTRAVTLHDGRALLYTPALLAGPLLVFIAALLLAPPVAYATLPVPMDRVLRTHHLPDSAVSLYVQDVDARQPAVAHHIDTPRNPASTIKLVTTFAALELLGPTHRWRTEAYTLGPVASGVLHGDLLLKGYGDPWLTEEEMWKFAGELRRRGLQRIAGRLLVDDTYYAPSTRDAGAFDGQPFRLYNVQPNALMVNFKAFTFDFTPRGDGVTIQAKPDLPNLEIVNRLKLVRAKCGGLAAAVHMAIPDPANPNRVVFSGDYPAGCGAQSLPRTAMDPANYAHGMFKAVWQQWGGELAGGVARGLAPAGVRPYATWYSPPLAELLRPLNKWSNNVMADAMLYAVAATSFAPPLTLEQGASVVTDWLTRVGIPTTDLILENGSGLSRRTRISARTMAEVLLHAWKSPYMPEFLASLSLAGLDGTLRNRFKNAPEAGRMHLKTGHLNDVAAVAGYVHAANGHTYIVVLLVNHAAANGGGGGALIDALLRWTHRQR